MTNEEKRINLVNEVEKAMGGKIDSESSLKISREFDIDALRKSSKEAAKVVKKENEQSNN